MSWPRRPPRVPPPSPDRFRGCLSLIASPSIENRKELALSRALCRPLARLGAGEDRVAPTLVNSDLALGDVGRPVRILMPGRERTVGLMPPLGQAFNDDQIAQLLTYIRRVWGNTGDAVVPSAVRDVRAATKGRTRPWTNEELAALGGSTP